MRRAATTRSCASLRTTRARSTCAISTTCRSSTGSRSSTFSRSTRPLSRAKASRARPGSAAPPPRPKSRRPGAGCAILASERPILRTDIGDLGYAGRVQGRLTGPVPHTTLPAVFRSIRRRRQSRPGSSRLPQDCCAEPTAGEQGQFDVQAVLADGTAEAFLRFAYPVLDGVLVQDDAEGVAQPGAMAVVVGERPESLDDPGPHELDRARHEGQRRDLAETGHERP